MWGRSLLVLLLLQHSQADSTCKNLRCFADYIRTLSCTWDTGPSGKPLNLTATWGSSRGGTCAFLPTFRNASHTRYTCSSEQKPCSVGDSFAVTVTTLVAGASAVHRKCQPFQCHENVQPPPPSSVRAVAQPGGYNISWESGYTAHDYLHRELQYQLRYRPKGQPWVSEGGTAGALKPLLQDSPTLWLLPQELEGGVEYELQVRARPRDHSLYAGTWSDWSSPSSLKTPPSRHTGAAWGLLVPLLGSGCIVSLVIFLCKQQRPWKKLEQFVPSPAPFFQPLYLAHKGDFKKWVGVSCPGATLEVYECSPVLPEVFRIRPKPLPTTAPPEETSAPPCSATPPASAEESTGSTLEPAYGHLSIDTVTVADACGLEPAEYRCLPLEPSPTEGPPARDSGCPGPWGREACLAQPEAGGLPEQHWNTPGGPVSCASSPPSTEPLCRRKTLSPTWAADGDPGDGLDLDTVDSGFADSECGSPVDGQFQGSCASSSAHRRKCSGSPPWPAHAEQREDRRTEAPDHGSGTCTATGERWQRPSRQPACCTWSSPPSSWLQEGSKQALAEGCDA